MGIFTKDIHTMEELFAHQLKDVYYAEHRITKALPKMIAKASSAALQEAFALLKIKPDSVTCQAIDGIIKEADEVASEVADPAVLDAGLLAAAQAVEHYEIARYGTLVAWAKRLGHHDAAALFETTLAEERAADQKLSLLANSEVNAKAA
jgi:ferritin-like metal-binding protein YciE